MEKFDKFEKLDRKVEETIHEVETMDKRKFFKNSFVYAAIWAFAINLIIETLGRFPTQGPAGGISFLFHSPIVFLYNTLIIFATLVIASLFKRRVFVFTIISIFWLILNSFSASNAMSISWFFPKEYSDQHDFAKFSVEGPNLFDENDALVGEMR